MVNKLRVRGNKASENKEVEINFPGANSMGSVSGDSTGNIAGGYGSEGNYTNLKTFSSWRRKQTGDNPPKELYRDWPILLPAKDKKVKVFRRNH